MSGGYDEYASQEETTDSFWEVGNYKRTVKRIDDGNRLCNDSMNCIQERAKIEKAYAQQSTDWSKRWRQSVDKGPQYGSVEQAWMAMMSEAERVSDLHIEIKNHSMSEDFEKVKNWQKDSYHKQMMGGFKETKEAEEGFKKAQKPWSKKSKEVEVSKKSYHMACKEEKLAATREANSKGDAATPAEQRKLQDKSDKCKQDSQKTREKYEKASDELNKCTPQYMENMEQVFNQCQLFEEKRSSFSREVSSDVKRHLNSTENQNYEVIYRDLERAITSASPEEDSKWFSNIHGPGMHMNWPKFEEYNPDLIHTISKREKSKKFNDEVMSTNVKTPGSNVQAEDRGSVSSYEKNQAYSSNEWSDDEGKGQNSGSDTNGGSNPFYEDSGEGVRVKASYDYEGQEQDELSFKAGDMSTKSEDEDDQGWCKGRSDNGQLGLYPANYVEPI